MRRLRSLALSAVLGLSACDGIIDDTQAFDARSDADTATVADADAGEDAVADAVPDAVPDEDAVPDAVPDAAPDAVAVPDAVPDADADPDGSDADAEVAHGTRVVWDPASALAATPNDHRFFDLPWPEDRRRDPDGTLALAGFPNPTDASGCELVTANPIIGLLLRAIPIADYRAYVTATADLRAHGFGTNTPIYFRFDGPLNPAPQIAGGDADDVWLVNIDPTSAHHGQRVPIVARVIEDSLYLPPHTLALTPVPGFPLDPATRYAAVVLRTLGDATGAPLETPPAFDALLADALSATPTTPEAARYVDALATLTQAGVLATDLAAVAVFTTQDPLAPMSTAAAAIAAIADPAPLAALEITAVTRLPDAGYYRVSGTLNTLDLQRGTPPYLPAIHPNVPVTSDNLLELLSPGGWSITFDAADDAGALLAGPAPALPDGADPDAPRTERVPFELTLPLAALDPGGDPSALPLVLYGHGTGGSEQSPLGPTREAPALAALGIATFSFPGVMHDDRAHPDNLDPALVADLQALAALLSIDVLGPLNDLVTGGSLFFNPLQLDAGRGNVLQSAVDFLFFARLFATTPLAVPLPDGGPTVTVAFDPAHLGFFGHSQGGLTGPLTALSPDLSLTFLSAPGGHLASSLLTKTLPADPFAVRDLFAWVVCDTGELDLLHPFFAPMTTFFEPADPLNYARLLVAEPVAGARHTFVTEGIADHYATAPANEAITTAARLTQVAPVLAPVAGQALLDALYGGFTPASADVSGNVEVDGRAVTAAFKQYHGDAGCADDHFVYLCVDQARQDWGRFFATWLAAPSPVVPAGP